MTCLFNVFDHHHFIDMDAFPKKLWLESKYLKVTYTNFLVDTYGVNVYVHECVYWSFKFKIIIALIHNNFVRICKNNIPIRIIFNFFDQWTIYTSTFYDYFICIFEWYFIYLLIFFIHFVIFDMSSIFNNNSKSGCLSLPVM